MFENNICIKSDSYKVTHWKQYPPGTTKIISYLESRGSTNSRYEGVVFFGLQYIIKKHLLGQQVTNEKIAEAKEYFLQHFGKPLFNEEGWQYIVDKHNGCLPIKIKAVPEGTYVKPLHNVLMVIENTDPECFWLTNFLETLLMQIWYPITVATNSHIIRDVISKYQSETSDKVNPDFSMIDFGFRGVTCYEQAGIGGMANLLSFSGTDNNPGIVTANNYYKAGICGFSIPASEHSTMTSWGKNNEDQAILNMIEQYPDMPVSCVGDSYNIYSFCERISKDPIRSKILNSSEGFKLVVRPDSGDPIEVVSKVLDILWAGFGGHYNSKHYKVLDPKIGIIQGDGIDLEMIDKLYTMAKNKKFSTDCFITGSGGALLQKFDRDTLKFAIKCNAAVINGKLVGVQKNPVTSSSKKSKIGELKLLPMYNTGEFHTQSSIPLDSITYTSEEFKISLLGAEFESLHDSLEVVFENGILIKEHTFDEIKKRLNS